MAEIHERISLFVNGQALQVPALSTLRELADRYDLDTRRLLVELNGETLLRDQWPSKSVHHGDRVEFIRVVAGG